jgi:hypothetical protein
VTDFMIDKGDPNCRHRKVYANHTLASNPPQRPWICEKCGAEGREYGRPIRADRYSEMRRRKRESQ